MTRAALLPAGGDPFLLGFWLRQYRTWASEVDELRIQVCGLEDPLVRGYIAEMCSEYPNVVVTFSGPRVDHGQVIARLLSETSADLVVLCEDDAYVRKPGVIAESFARIESDEVDIVASPRATGTPEVTMQAARTFGWQVMDTTEAGPFMWPCFLFAKRSDLLRVDNYSVKHWKPGDPVLGLGYTVQSENDADTFADASMQLMGLGLRVHWQPQYRSDERLMSSWTDAPWFHVGSLSGSTDYLLGRKDHVDRAAWVADVAGNPDWAKRLSFWQRAVETAEGLPDLASRYRSEIAAVIDEAQVPSWLISEWRRRFDPFVTWA